MAFTPQDMKGSLFPNDRKQSANQPDVTGSIMIGGKLWRLAGWFKQGSRGEFTSLAASEPQQQQEPRQDSPPRQQRTSRPAPAQDQGGGGNGGEQGMDDMPF